jgi:hypothetical protein
MSDKPIIIGIATYDGKGRSKSLSQALGSLMGHGAKVYLYDNSRQLLNLTDNGKFYGLTRLTEPCYYFTCDDDLIYPPSYIPDMIAKIKEHKCIVTHHGRILTREGVPYYKGHKTFRCLNDVVRDEIIDVPGTGCMAFDTEYFNPTELWKSNDLRMSDLIFALEAKKQDKKIMVLKHQTGYIQHSSAIDLRDTIFAKEQGNTRQNEIADQIFKMK